MGGYYIGIDATAWPLHAPQPERDAVSGSSFLKQSKGNRRYKAQGHTGSKCVRPAWRFVVARVRRTIGRGLALLAALLSACQPLLALECPCRAASAASAEHLAEDSASCSTGHEACGCHDHGCSQTKRSAETRQPVPQRSAGAPAAGPQPGCDCPEGCSCEQHHSTDPAVPVSETTPVDHGDAGFVNGALELAAGLAASSTGKQVWTQPLDGHSDAGERRILLCRFVV
jgi:hypothetical protein